VALRSSAAGPETPEDRRGLTTNPFHICQGFPGTETAPVAPDIGEGFSPPATLSGGGEYTVARALSYGGLEGEGLAFPAPSLPLPP